MFSIHTRRCIISLDMKLHYKSLVILLLLVFTGSFHGDSLAQEKYNPVINPEDFSTVIDNPYFTMIPGTTFVFEKESDEGVERIEAYVTDTTRNIIGVETLVVYERTWLEDELIEETYDWFAQDKEGNVWYFGEDSKEFEDGEVSTTFGSWEAGVNDAKPGILMKAKPAVGDFHYQEYSEGVAIDTSDILDVNVSIKTKFGSFTGCVKNKEGSALAKDLLEHKYYCPEAGNVVYIIDVGSGEEEVLVEIIKEDVNGETNGIVLKVVYGVLVVVLLAGFIRKLTKKRVVR
jgi:hypothetical protein